MSKNNIKTYVAAAAKKKKQAPNIERGVTALYVRVSTDAQAEEGYSIDAQVEKLTQWCKIKGYGAYEVYQDGGWSGSNLDRPEMKRMITDIINGNVVRVLVYKLDRLSRSQVDTLFLLEEVFIPNGVEFFSMNENFDTGTPYGKAMVGILSVFAQLERENIRQRTQMGMYQRVKDGYWMGGARIPFGYDYDQNQDILVPNEHASEVKEMYDLYLQGYSTTRLAKMYPVCSDNQVAAILSRVTYLGKINYNGEIVQGRHTPIIDEDTWMRVQEERKKRSNKGVVKSSYLFTGLLVCGKCEAKMRYQKWSGNKIRICCYSRYPSTPHLVKDPNCKNPACFAHEVEPLILEDLFQLTDRIDTENLSDVSLAQRRTPDEIKVLQNRYDTLSQKIKRLYNLYAESGDEILLETIEENKASLKTVSEMIENEKASKLELLDEKEKKAAVSNLRGRWSTMSFDEKRKSVLLCIEKIEITDGVVDIKYLI